MIHQRNQAQIFVRSFSYTSILFKDTSEGLQSTSSTLKIHQKECLAAILKVRNSHSRNMKFTSSTFIFRGGLLGNKLIYRVLKGFYRVLKTLPIVHEPADSTRLYRQTLPIVLSTLSAQSLYR